MLSEFNVQGVTQYLEQYGGYLLFFLMFLEYLKITGLPSGIVLPASGMLIARGNSDFFSAILITFVAAIMGSLTAYFIGYTIGRPVLDKVCNKSKKIRKVIDVTFAYVDRYGAKSYSVIRLIPVARTIISVVAGSARVKLIPFMLYSAIGIFIWNLAYMFLGYAVGYFLWGN